ncbi:hypothetical protein HYPSUDRAFT_220604 [Hypholoma sublateritium FD-334 SS-4]|uniref:CBM1 domain-containing protein n=1 Tax=Hypholoma sublateritium (strain FD-334 SS-4) TaxID=945553 RepID=A0A0D2P0I6_HYPSF|nr:hypothetical protein HYPSUDRAFT_220604 [Hypholoma sublateritium FD-334 SS-4]
MKFSLATIALSVALVFSQTAIATHCQIGDNGSTPCPTGWRCCGPIIDGVGGTCFEGETGICPL